MVAGQIKTRRRFLTAATSAVSAVGVVGVAVPFLGSWNPSEKAKAAGAPVKADIGKIAPGQMVVVEWRGKPVYVLRRTPEQLSDLTALDGDLKDLTLKARTNHLHRGDLAFFERRAVGGCRFVYAPWVCSKV